MGEERIRDQRLMGLWASAEFTGKLKMEESATRDQKACETEGKPGQGEGWAMVRRQDEGYRTEQCGGRGGRRAELRDWPGAYLVESHLVDFLRRTALFPGAQFVAQLLGHGLHHVIPQLHIPHFCPCVLVILGEFGQVESQALAELVEDPEGEGEAGEGAGG